MHYEAIQYPAHFPPTNRWKKFFVGVRGLGPDLAFFKELRELQAARPQKLMKVWGGGLRQEVAELLSVSLAKDLGWASTVFLPSDEASPVFTGPSFRSLDGPSPEEIARPLKDKYGFKAPPSFWFDKPGATLGELVDELLKHVHAGT